MIKALLKAEEYLQWALWFQDVAGDCANSNARAGTPQNQVTFEMLTDTVQFDAGEAQIQCPPLLHVRKINAFVLRAYLPLSVRIS